VLFTVAFNVTSELADLPCKFTGFHFPFIITRIMRIVKYLIDTKK